MENIQKKPYESPKIFRVELNQEQAVLAACNTAAAGLPSNSGTRTCRSDCRQSSKGGGGNAINPS